MNEAVEILGHWLGYPHGATIESLGNAGGFSGARIWRVEVAGRKLALKCWPENSRPATLASAHGLQIRLARAGLPTAVPRPALTTGQSFISEHNHYWELAPWLPGQADYWTDPRPEKLVAAMRVLARIHQVLAQAVPPEQSWQKPIGLSRALMDRSDRLHKLLSLELKQSRAFVHRRAAPGERPLLMAALALIERLVPAEVEKSLRWRDEPINLQWCLRDVWHDHVLFTGDRVTGLLDFGAATYDAPAGDVARLLGSLVGDDSQGWREGLDAYEAVRPLAQVEREAIPFFDASGSVISAANWVVWLWPTQRAAKPIVNRPAALARLQRLVERMRVLAGK